MFVTILASFPSVLRVFTVDSSRALAIPPRERLSSLTEILFSHYEGFHYLQAVYMSPPPSPRKWVSLIDIGNSTMRILIINLKSNAL